MCANVAVIGGLGKFNRVDIQRHEEDMDISAGWEMDLFLNPAVVDDVTSVSSSHMWEDWNYSVATSEHDRWYSLPAHGSRNSHQEERHLHDYVEHEDQMRKDLRSASIPYKRDADQGQKYYYFKAVKPGDIGQAYYTAPDDTSRLTSIGLEVLPADRSEAKVEVWTKRDLFVQAQRYPRPPQHHHHCRGCNEGRNAWTQRQARTSDIKQTLKVFSTNMIEEDRLIDLDVITESLWDDWKYPSHAHAHSYVEVVEAKNNKIAGEILDRAIRRWKNRRRCESSGAPLSVTSSRLSLSSWDCPTPSNICEETVVGGAWELLSLL